MITDTLPFTLSCGNSDSIVSMNASSSSTISSSIAKSRIHASDAPGGMRVDLFRMVMSLSAIEAV